MAMETEIEGGELIQHQSKLGEQIWSDGEDFRERKLQTSDRVMIQHHQRQKGRQSLNIQSST